MDARIRLILGITSNPDLVTLKRNNVGTYWIYRFCNKSNVPFIFSSNGCAGCDIPILVRNQGFPDEDQENRLVCSALSTIHPSFETNLKMLMDEHRLEAHNILVVHDELHIETGRVRYQIGNGKGQTSHLGLRTLYNVLKTDQIHHLQVGIGLIQSQDSRQIISYLNDSLTFMDKDKVEGATDFSFGLIQAILKGRFQVAQRIINARDFTLAPDDNSIFIDPEKEKQIADKRTTPRPRI